MTPTPDPIKTIEADLLEILSKYKHKQYNPHVPIDNQEKALTALTQAINNELLRARENTGMKYANGEPILLGDTVDVPYITPMGDLTDDIDEEKRAEVVFDKGLFGLKYPYHVTPLRDYCRKTKGEYISNYGEVTIWSDNTVLVKAAIKSSGGVTPPIQQSQTEGGE